MEETYETRACASIPPALCVQRQQFPGQDSGQRLVLMGGVVQTRRRVSAKRKK